MELGKFQLAELRQGSERSPSSLMARSKGRGIQIIIGIASNYPDGQEREACTYVQKCITQ
jgi:hypothetical protein